MAAYFEGRLFLCSVFAIFLQVNLMRCSLLKDSFNEELFIKPLSSGYVYSYFQFTTKWDIDIKKVELRQLNHFNFFPKSLGEILTQYQVRELHFSLTQGTWRHQLWGYPVNDAPAGAELWVWFHESAENIDELWFELSNSLAGLFCASLNFIDSTNTFHPTVSFRPNGVATDSYANNSTFLRYAVLPRETVCTENLTPWKKLLPCSTKAGLSTLINAIQIFNTHYHSLALHFRPICRTSSCQDVSLELSQSVSVVSDLTTVSNGKQDWSFKKLYGSGLFTSCPVATISKIYVDTTESKGQFVLRPEPTQINTTDHNGMNRHFAVYDIRKILEVDGVLNVMASYNRQVKYGLVPPPALHANCFVNGFGQEQGGVTCHLHNTLSKAITIIFMQSIPWFLYVYLHSLKINSNGIKNKPLYLEYIPGKNRERASFLEMILRLPAKSITEINLEFDRTLLMWTEYTPDANHGFYIGSAVISTILDSSKNYTALPQDSSTIASSFNVTKPGKYFVQIHTEPLLISLPTPDFSMPFNVICLTCTILAIAFGPIHNVTTKRLQIVDPSEPGIVSKFVLKLKKILRLKPKKEEENEDMTEDKDFESKKKD